MFLEYAEVFGNHFYGTARQSLDEARAAGPRPAARYRCAGRSAGARRNAGGGEHLCAAAQPQVLRTRLRNRSRAEGVVNEAEALPPALSEASKEIENYREYGYILVNDILDRAVAQLGGHCAGRALLSQWRAHRLPFAQGVGGRRGLPAVELAGAA